MNVRLLNTLLIIFLVAGAIVYIYSITRTKEEISISEQQIILPSPSISKFDCPNIITSDKDWLSKPIIIDGEQMPIAKYFPAMSNNIIVTDGDIKSRIKRIVAENPSAIISLKSSNSTSIKAYISRYSENYEKSRKLACLIINQLSDNFNGSNIISINPEFYSESAPEYILKTNRIAVLVELGSQQQISQISLANNIFKGVRQYYE